MAAMEQGDWATAETKLARAIESCPVDAVAREHYAEALWRRGAKAEALAEIEEAIRLRGDDVELEIRAAEMLLELDRPERAEAHIRWAIELDPQAPAAWLVIGKLRLREGKPDEALGYYHRALGMDSDDRGALRAIAELHAQTGEAQRALVGWNALADTYAAGEVPPDVLLGLAGAYRGTGRFDDAIAALNSARWRGAPEAEVCRRMAETWQAAGRPDLAQRAAQAAVAHEWSGGAGDPLASRGSVPAHQPIGQARSGSTALR